MLINISFVIYVHTFWVFEQLGTTALTNYCLVNKPITNGGRLI